MWDLSFLTRSQTHVPFIVRQILNQQTMREVLVWLVTQSCPTLCSPMDCSPPGSSVHGDSPGKNTGVGSHALLQGIFSTQGSNSGLPHCRWILYCLSHQGSPRILEWVAYPFSRGSSQPRKGTGVSCIIGRFVTSWTAKESPCSRFYRKKNYAQNNIGRINPKILIAVILSDTIKSYIFFYLLVSIFQMF